MPSLNILLGPSHPRRGREQGVKSPGLEARPRSFVDWNCCVTSGKSFPSLSLRLMGTEGLEVLRGLNEVRHRKCLVPRLTHGQSLINGSPLDEEDPTPEGPGQGMLHSPVLWSTGASQQSPHHLVGWSRIPGRRDALCDFRFQVSFKALPGLIFGFVSDPNAQMERGEPSDGKKGKRSEEAPPPPPPLPHHPMGTLPRVPGVATGSPGTAGARARGRGGPLPALALPAGALLPEPLPPSLQTAGNRERVGGAEHPRRPPCIPGTRPARTHTGPRHANPAGPGPRSLPPGLACGAGRWFIQSRVYSHSPRAAPRPRAELDRPPGEPGRTAQRGLRSGGG